MCACLSSQSLQGMILVVCLIHGIYIYMYYFGFIEMEKTTKECALCLEQVAKDQFSSCLHCEQCFCGECSNRWRGQQLKQELIPSCPFCRHKDSSSHVPIIQQSERQNSWFAHPFIQRCLLFVLIALIVSMPLTEFYFSKDSVFWVYAMIACSLVAIFCYHSHLLQCQEEEENYDDYAV